MNDIKAFLEHQESPSVNGIILPNGEVQLIDVNVDWGPPVKYQLHLTSRTSINELCENGKLFWNDCATIARIVDEKNCIEVVSGEGDYGSDGFVAVSNLDSKELIWLAFFESSNPFEQLEFDESSKVIHAKNSLGNLWSFPLNNPSAVTVR